MRANRVNITRLDNYSIDVTVKITRRFRVRMFLFMMLLKIALWIAPVDSHLEVIDHEA